MDFNYNLGENLRIHFTLCNHRGKVLHHPNKTLFITSFIYNIFKLNRGSVLYKDSQTTLSLKIYVNFFKLDFHAKSNSLTLF